MTAPLATLAFLAGGLVAALAAAETLIDRWVLIRAALRGRPTLPTRLRPKA